MFNASVSRKISGAKEIEGDAGILGDLSYLGHNGGLEVVPQLVDDDSVATTVNLRSDRLTDTGTLLSDIAK